MINPLSPLQVLKYDLYSYIMLLLFFGHGKSRLLIEMITQNLKRLLSSHYDLL